METNSYSNYLETIILSLLAERPDSEADIVSTDLETPSFRGVTFSPYNVQKEIEKHRLARRDAPKP